MAEMERLAGVDPPVEVAPGPPDASSIDAELERLRAESAAAAQEAARQQAVARQASLRVCLDDAALEMDAANRTADQRRRQAESDAAARGAGNSSALEWEYERIEADRASARASYDLAVQSCQLAFG
jgi:hypothetical protein